VEEVVVRQFKTQRIIELFTGVVGLDENQAKRRRASLKEIKKGVYEIMAPVQFKAGEVIYLSEIPKPYRAALEEIGAEPGGGKRAG
jgi:hypothetical protein